MVLKLEVKPIEGHSPFLLNLFEMSKPKKYKTYENN